MQTLIWANIMVGVIVLVLLFTANSEDTENKDRDIIYGFVSLFFFFKFNYYKCFDINYALTYSHD